MHGTYFAQNEVFEDESAGEVRLPLSSLGAERRVYLGKSVEGVLRHRSAAEARRLICNKLSTFKTLVLSNDFREW